jgi:serine/threonine-protein kinase RsbW
MPDADPPSTPERLRVPSSLDQLTTVLAWYDRFRHPPLSTELWVQGQTALVEGFSNAVRHAQAALAAPPPVELEACLSDQEFRILISDHGPAFDLEQALGALREVVSAKDFDPLARDEHWGLILLLRLRNDHGWSISHQRTDDGRNRLRLCHGLGLAA